MYKEKKILAIIPARGGSKGLPRKNIKLLSGKPLIAWTIEQAKKSSYLDKIVVSTDDKEIADISKKYGAEVPFSRPKELATDDAKSIDAIFHALEWLRQNREVYDIVVMLQPTSPLREAEDIDKAIELLMSKDAEGVVSVCRAEHPPLWSNTIPEDGCMKNFLAKKIMNTPRQALPVYYRLNGAVYLGYCDYLKKIKGFFGDKTYAYIMPSGRSTDIDTEMDFDFVEYFMSKGK